MAAVYYGAMAKTKAGGDAWRLMFTLLMEGEARGRLGGCASELKISPGMLKSLFHLQPGDGVAMRDLSEHWKVDASWVTSLVDALEERGLAERRAHPTDRRVKMVALTDKGVRMKEEALQYMYAPPSAVEVLTAAEQVQLRDLLQKMADADPRLSELNRRERERQASRRQKVPREATA